MSPPMIRMLCLEMCQKEEDNSLYKVMMSVSLLELVGS